MRWRNTETPTFAGSDGTRITGPDIVETLELLDRDGNVIATFTKNVAGDASFALTGDLAVTGDASVSGDVTEIVTEAELSLSDNTTANSSTTKHGFLKKLSNVATEFMNGAGNWVAAMTANVSVDNTIARYDGIAGQVQGSGWTINDSHALNPNTDNVSDIGNGSVNPRDISANRKIVVGKAATSTGQIDLAGTTSGVVSVKPADAAGTWTLTLPTNDGDAGEFLQTNGSGVTSWVDGVRVARATYSFAVDGGTQGLKTPANSDTIPDNAIILGGQINATTAATSGGSATIAIGTSAGSSAAAIKAATAVASFSADALLNVVPTFAAALKLTAAGTVTFTIADADLTAGVIEVFLLYVVPAA